MSNAKNIQIAKVSHPVDLTGHVARRLLWSLVMLTSSLVKGSWGTNTAVTETLEPDETLSGVKEDTHMAEIQKGFYVRDAKLSDTARSHIHELEMAKFPQEEIDQVRLSYLYKNVCVLTETRARGPYVVDVGPRDDEGFWQRYCNIKDANNVSTMLLNLL